MTAQRSTYIPPLTAAHQARFNLLLKEISTSGQFGEYDVVLLQQLVGDLPRMRSTQSSDIREALTSLDQNEGILSSAIASLLVNVSEVQSMLDGDTLPPQHMLEVTTLTTLAEKAHGLSQAATEVALRATERANMLKRHERQQ